MLQALEAGALRGVSVTASGYSCASAISWFQARDELTEWSRVRRHGRRSRLTVSHLLASAALPLLFATLLADGDENRVGAIVEDVGIAAESLASLTSGLDQTRERLDGLLDLHHLLLELLGRARLEETVPVEELFTNEFLTQP